MKKNLCLEVDSYKTSHHKMYPNNMTGMYSYFECRQGSKWTETVFFGLQYYMKEYLQGVTVTKEDVEEAKIFVDEHIGPNVFPYNGWMRVVNVYGGKLPVRIKAVAEGSVITKGNALMSIESIDPEIPWIVNWLETLLVRIWYTCAVSTLCRENKKIIAKYRAETGGLPGLDFAFLDFGARGGSSSESVDLAGMSHLLSWKGSDTMQAVKCARKYYNTKAMLAWSAKASEHSTVTSWGRNGEAEMVSNAIEKYPDGILSMVSDSYDIFNMAGNILGQELKDKILARNGLFVVRPDSGNPVKLLPELIGILGDHFGLRKNAEGYLVLNDKIRVLHGDGIKYETIPGILEELKKCGYSAENLTLGSGGGIHAGVTRDTLACAFKCSEVTVNGERRDVFKDPITDTGKTSKKGHLALIKDETGFHTIREEELNGRKDLLETVFENGEIIKEYTFEEAKENAKI